MPPRRNEEQPSSESTAMVQRSFGALSSDVLPDDLKADLLRAQAGQISLAGKLTKLKVMGAGVGMFEIVDSGGEPFRDVLAVILNGHDANVLWDRPYGSTNVPDGEKAAACSSNDGRWGIPRVGFAHEGLPHGVVGDGVRQVECAQCPYNKWGTGAKFIPNRNPKGKAVTNQKRLYLLIPGREMPLELTLPSTSIKTYEKYVKDLTDQGIIIQTIMTKVFQTVEGPPTNRYGVVQFQNMGNLNADELRVVLDKRTRYAGAINPASPAQEVVVSDLPSDEELNSDIPF
jgi:hypothetical protein